MSRTPHIVLILCFLFSLPALADEKDLSDMSIEELMNVTISTASKKEEKLDEAPGSITVISRQQIIDSNARTLRDVLNAFVPGMDVVPADFRYGDPVNEGIYSRGLLSDFSQQVLILYNGMAKFNEATWASPFPAVEFTLDNIERVEVSRSPIPLYGSAAITVINLITRDQYLDNKVEGKVDLAASRETTFGRGPQRKNASVLWGKSTTSWIFGGSLQAYSDAGQSYPDDHGKGTYALPNDTLKDGTKGAVSWTLTGHSKDDKWMFQSWYKWTDRDNYLAGQLPSQSNDLYKYEGTEFLNNLRYRPNSNWEFVLGLQASKWTNIYDSSGTPTGGDESDYEGSLEAIYRDTLGSAHALTAGLKYEREGQYDATGYLWNGSGFDSNKDPNNTTNPTFAPNDARDVVSAYAEDTWKIAPHLSLLGGLRADHYNGYAHEEETHVNPRLALAWAATDNWTFKALYSSAARPPSIYERSGEHVAPLKGNKNIHAEKVSTSELSAIYKRSGFKAQLTPFYQIIQDKIQFAQNGASEVATNDGNSFTHGVDLELWYYFTANTYIFANGTYLRSYDDDDHHDTYFLPSQYYNAGINWRIGELNLNTYGHYRGERKLDPSLTDNIAHASAAQFQMNASASYDLSQGTRVFLLIENLTGKRDKYPLSADGLAVADRGTTVNLGCNWEL